MAAMGIFYERLLHGRTSLDSPGRCNSCRLVKTAKLLVESTRPFRQTVLSSVVMKHGLLISEVLKLYKCRGQMISIPASYSVAPGFKSSPGGRLSWSFSLFPSVSPDIFHNGAFSQATTSSCWVPANSLLTNQPIIHSICYELRTTSLNEETALLW
jgi:hypothetical protein